jgi:hypothetical protein
MSLALIVGLLAALPLRAQQTVARYTIEQFMNTKSIFGASFAPDERSILVTSDESGVFNAYEVPVDGGPMRPVTSSTDDAVFSVGFFPGDRRILYLQDDGGNELHHLYVRAEDGTVRDLTPGEQLKAVFFGWAHERGSFFYGTNARDRRFFDVFEAPTATLEPRLIYQDTVGLSLGSVSPDGRWIAFVKSITTNNNDLYLRDNHAGELRHITPHTGNVNHQPMTFSRDSRHLYYVTDEGGEFARLVRRDLATGEVTEVERADCSRGGAPTWWWESTTTPGPRSGCTKRPRTSRWGCRRSRMATSPAWCSRPASVTWRST